MNSRVLVPSAAQATELDGTFVTSKKPPSGRFQLVTTSYTAGKWDCSSYYFDVCRWSSSEDETYANTFTWDGAQITYIKSVSPKRIKTVRL
jgi:hypothetical protein